MQLFLWSFQNFLQTLEHDGRWGYATAASRSGRPQETCFVAVCKQAAAFKDIGGLSFCSLLMVANTHGVGTIESFCQGEPPTGTCA